MTEEEYIKQQEDRDKENLLQETLNEMSDIGKTEKDVVFIGNGECTCMWYEFVILADRKYDSGYGGAEVDTNLVVKFTDGTWLSRGEYDGSEWWSYNTPPTPPSPPRTLTKLFYDK